MASVAVVMCVALVLVLATVVHAAPKESVCAELEKPCHENGECCGGCCHENKCAVYADYCAVTNNPCNLHACPPNKVCYLAQVECLQSPCQPIPACKADDTDYD